MKDIKTLYLDAKARGTTSAVKAYSEAVQELLESNPLGYYSQAEYIISSSIGLKTFPEFVEKWGLPIPAYDHVMELLEGAVAKAEDQKKDATPYQEAINYLEAFRAKYPHCFAMYETVAYIPNNPFTGCVENAIDEYIEKYYSSDHNSKHVQGRMLPSMASNLKFGYIAIPDLMITAGTLGPNALKSVFEYFKTSDTFYRSPSQFQFIYECSKDVNTDQVSEYVESLKMDGIETMVESSIQRNRQIFREAAIVGEDNAKVILTEQELVNIQELITIKEAIIAEGGQSAVDTYNDVMRLYESLDGFIDEAGNVVAEDVADSVIPNLPIATGEAAPWMANTMNKKTGAMPIYISRNHDLGYGEEPTSGAKRPMDDDGDTDPTLDDFRRKDTPSGDDDDTIDPEDDPPKDTDAPASSAEPSGNNYYYYTYNNSLNQNRNSFNKDNSTHDDHSRKQDDHSSGKHINSDNVTGDTDDEEEGEFQALESAEDFSDFNKAKKDPDEKEKAKEVLKEMFQFQGKLGEGIELGTSWAGRPTMDDMRRISSTLCESYGVNPSEKKDMFSLDVHRVYNPFMELGVDDTFLEEFILMCEGAKQDWRQECRMFQQMFNHDLDKLGDIKSPPKKITLNLDGKKMCFHTSKGYSQTTGRQMERYAQIPTSIHNFNVNRDDFVEDRIGIAKGVIHRLRMIDANCPKNITIADAVKQYNLAPARFIFKPCGEIGITFTSNIKGKSIGLNIEPDLTVHDGDEEVAMEGAQFIMEGVLDKVSKGINKLSKKIKAFFGKKTLANLQKNDFPEAWKDTSTPMVIGTNIPIPIEGMSSSGGQVEEVKEYVGVQELIEHGCKFTDDIDEAFTEDATSESKLSKKEIKKAVDAIRHKFNAEVLFVHRAANPLGGRASTDGAYVIRATDEMIKQIKDGKRVNAVRIADTFGPENIDKYKSVIIIVPSILSHENITSAKDIEVTISHEYGHVLTFDKITDDDWVEYNVKVTMLQYCGTVLMKLLGMSHSQAFATVNVYYHKLKPEALANEAGKVDPMDIIRSSFKAEPMLNQQALRLDEVVKWNIKPAAIAAYRRLSSSGKNTLHTTDDVKAIFDANVDIYSKLFVNPDVSAGAIAHIKAGYEEDIKKAVSKETAEKSDQMISKVSKEEFDQITKKKYHGPAHYIKKVAKKTAGKFKEGAEESIGFVVVYTEDVAAADMKPESDHPIRDRLMDFDRETTKVQQAAKKKVQEVQQGAKAFAKPVQRSMQWVGKMVHEWRDMDENKLKEKIADPHARNNLFSAIGSAIKYGSLAKAGLLLNPVFLFLSITKGINHNRNITRLRNEIMGELDAEIEIINEKIHQADQDKKPHEKYKLMRFRKELEKKKLRVGGGQKISRVL